MSSIVAAGPRGPVSRGDYGQRWGEGAARCFSIESDLDEDESVRLMPIPECFICPMSQTPMEDPVMTVDGCVYERSYIEQWIRHRQQHRLRVSSPATNQELPSHRLVSLSALQKAIEAYLAHRPELRGSLTASRSFEEAAQLLQSDLLEKQAAHVSAEDELSLLRDSNEVLFGALHDAERSCHGVRKELEQAWARVKELESMLEAKTNQCSTLEENCETLLSKTKELERSSHFQTADASVGSAGCLSPDAVLNIASQQVGKDGTARCCAASRPDGRSASVVAAAATAAAEAAAAAVKGSGKSVHPRPAGKRNRQVSESRPGINLRMFSAGGLFLLLSLMAVFSIRERLWLSIWRGGSSNSSVSVLGSSPRAVSEDVVTQNISSRASRQEARKVEWRREERGKDRRPELKQAEFDPRSKDEEGHWESIDDLPIEGQVMQLRSGSVDERTQAALVLSIMAATSSENQAAIVRAGAVSHLVDMLQGTAPSARGQAAVALRALAANSTYNKVAIVRAGAIPALIRLLKENEVEVQEVAAGALQTLAETSNQVEIAQAGAIVPLVALLKDQRPGVREEAAGALVILALNADNQVAIAQVGAIPLLVDLLKDEVAEVREQAAAALRNLAAENVDNQVAIARAGAFTPLTLLLSDDRPGVREEALAALRNLAGSAPDADFTISDTADAIKAAAKAAAR